MEWMLLGCRNDFILLDRGYGILILSPSNFICFLQDDLGSYRPWIDLGICHCGIIVVAWLYLSRSCTSLCVVAKLILLNLFERIGCDRPLFYRHSIRMNEFLTHTKDLVRGSINYFWIQKIFCALICRLISRSVCWSVGLSSYLLIFGKLLR